MEEEVMAVAMEEAEVLVAKRATHAVDMGT